MAKKILENKIEAQNHERTRTKLHDIMMETIYLRIAKSEQKRESFFFLQSLEYNLSTLLGIDIILVSQEEERRFIADQERRLTHNLNNDHYKLLGDKSNRQQILMKLEHIEEMFEKALELQKGNLHNHHHKWLAQKTDLDLDIIAFEKEQERLLNQRMSMLDRETNHREVLGHKVEKTESAKEDDWSQWVDKTQLESVLLNMVAMETKRINLSKKHRTEILNNVRQVLTEVSQDKESIAKRVTDLHQKSLQLESQSNASQENSRYWNQAAETQIDKIKENQQAVNDIQDKYLDLKMEKEDRLDKTQAIKNEEFKQYSYTMALQEEINHRIDNKIQLMDVRDEFRVYLRDILYNVVERTIFNAVEHSTRAGGVITMSQKEATIKNHIEQKKIWDKQLEEDLLRIDVNRKTMQGIKLENLNLQVAAHDLASNYGLLLNAAHYRPIRRFDDLEAPKKVLGLLDEREKKRSR